MDPPALDYRVADWVKVDSTVSRQAMKGSPTNKLLKNFMLILRDSVLMASCGFLGYVKGITMKMLLLS
jgi:hypothetical protein